ncbi:ParB N-terminal domain-containing protein [Lentzea sp. JNUCC 0626]|uniref:ParB/RepB/Spo0J family partition protein n=1 Tax=Lentzea sp. JNUCC 0626 TaxID=3367513 RepID=UPI003748B938
MSSSTDSVLSARLGSHQRTRPVVRLRISALRRGRGVRVDGENAPYVRQLADVPEKRLPPVVVHRKTMNVVDGLHRWCAAELRGASHIAAVMLDGDDFDAFIFALQANKGHKGLPLTRADLRAAIEHVLSQRPQWADRRIAAVTGVAARTVANARIRLGDRTEVRVGSDGRKRSRNSARRRALVRELLLDQPHLSLRAVAREVGVSPETVRAVRAGLHDEARLPPPSEGKPVPAPRAETPMDNTTLLHWLHHDPALRASQRGRALLRLLQLESELRASWTDFTDHVPPHCRAGLAAFARQNATSWRSMAELLERDLAS